MDQAFLFVVLIVVFIFMIIVKILTKNGKILEAYHLMFVFLVVVLLAFLYFFYIKKRGKDTFRDYRMKSVILKDMGIALITGGFIVIVTSANFDADFFSGAAITFGGLVNIILSGKYELEADVAETNHNIVVNKYKTK
jgi:hypothetical protein